MAIAIGDIHGCLGALRLLIEKLPPQAELIFLGDYIDRGPDSALVIRYLKHLAYQRPCRFLKGNHEDMLVRTLVKLPVTAPAVDSTIDLWLANGGRATLSSYGLRPHQWRRTEDRSEVFRADLDFFHNLELYAEDQHAIYVHAGIDVGQPDLTQQKPQILLWIRERFYRRARTWVGKPIVFGHTPTSYMGCRMGEVFQDGPLTGIDTGCVYGGRLTALDTKTGRIYQEAANQAYA